MILHLLSGVIQTPSLRPSTCHVTCSPAPPRGSQDPGARVVSHVDLASRHAASRVTCQAEMELQRDTCPQACVQVTTAT